MLCNRVRGRLLCSYYDHSAIWIRDVSFTASLWYHALVFVLGLLTLALPIAYIRSISKGTTTPLTVDPPSFPSTLIRFNFAALNLMFASYEYGKILFWQEWFWWDVWRIVWLLVSAVSAVGFFLSIRDWNAGGKRTLRNGLLMFLPVISSVLMTILHLPF